MTRTILILLAMSFFGAPAMAQATAPAVSRARTDLALEMMRVTKSEQMFDEGMKAATGPMLDGMMQSMMADPRTKAIVEANPDLPKRLGDIVTSQLQAVMVRVKPKLLDQMPGLYASVFSEQEMRDMLVFYKTPGGQSMLQKMPQLMAATQQLTMQLLSPELATMGPAIQSAVQAEMTSLKKPAQK
jgi:uncharacterized protein